MHKKTTPSKHLEGAKGVSALNTLWFNCVTLIPLFYRQRGDRCLDTRWDQHEILVTLAAHFPHSGFLEILSGHIALSLDLGQSSDLQDEYTWTRQQLGNLGEAVIWYFKCYYSRYHVFS